MSDTVAASPAGRRFLGAMLREVIRQMERQYPDVDEFDAVDLGDAIAFARRLLAEIETIN